MVDVSARFRYDGNFGPLQAQIKALTRDIAVLNASFVSMDRAALATKKQLAESFAANINATGRFKTSFVDLTSATEEFGRALEKNRLTMRQYFSEARKAYRQDSMTRRLAQRQVRMMQSQVIDIGDTGGGRRRGMVVTPLTLDTSDFTTKMQLATQQYAIFNKLVSDGANQLINWGKNTQWAGRQLTVGITVPLTIFGAVVSKTFREVDAELTRFAKVYGSDLVAVNGAATEQMKRQIQDLAVEYSRTYGIAAKETIALAADIAATGKEGDQLLGSVQQTTRLAVLGEVDRQEAMRTTLAIQSAFNQDTKELADTINFLNAVENQTSTSLQDFTAAIPKAGPVVRQLGGDIKDLAVMLTAMREGGIPAAEAANAIKSGLSALINPTKAAEERLAKLGVNITDIVQKNRGELMPTLMEFSGVVNQLDQFSRAQVIEELFGRYQFARISALFDNLNKTGSQTAQVMEIVGLSTADLAKAANKEINALTESVSMRFTRAVEGLKASLIPLGEILTSAVIPFIEGTATAVGKVIEIFESLPGPIKNSLKLFLGLTAAAGPIIMLAGVFGNFLGYMTKGVMTLTNFARRLMGLPTQKLEILDDQTLAASRATDLLTQSFERESASLSVLNTNLSNYLANIRRVAGSNPALFVPGSPARPLRRSMGGDIPGYGGGDRVPALLEPGEFVVRKEVASKNRGFLRSLNSGSIQRFQNGGEVGDSGLARSHIAVEYTGEGKDRRKIFGGLVSIENQGYNQAIEKNPDIFPGKKQPITFEDFDQSRKRLREKIDRMVSRGEVVPLYLEDAIKSMDNDYRLYSKHGIDRAPQRFKEELAKRIAMGTLSTMPRSLRGQKDYIFEQEKARVLKILSMQGLNPEELRKALVESSRQTSYMAGNKRIDLFSRLGRKGSEKFGSPSKSIVLPIYEGRGTLPSQIGREFLSEKGIGVYSPGYRAGLAQVQARPGTPQEQRTPRGTAPRIPVSIEKDEVTVPRKTYGQNGVFIDTDGRAFKLPMGVRFPFMRPFLDNGGIGGVNGRVNPPEVYDITTRQRTSPDPRFGDYSDSDRGPSARRAGVGSTLMNVGFAGSMLAGMSAMNGEVTAATTALTAFTTALMLAGTALEMKNMFGGMGGKGKGAGGRGLFGLKGAGQAMQARGAATAANAAGGMGRLGGTALLTAGRGVAMLGGPIGIGVAAALTVGILAYQQHQKNLEDMRNSAKAAFEEAGQSAEYFGLSLGGLSEKGEELVETLDQMGIKYSNTADQIDEDFIQRVGSDYENLINRLKGREDIDSIASDFKMAYSSLISQGFGKDEANAILEEVARQAQQTEVYVNVRGQWEGIETPEQAAQVIATDFVDNLKAAENFISPETRQQAFEDLINRQNEETEALQQAIEEANNAYREALAAGDYDAMSEADRQRTILQGEMTALAVRQQQEREAFQREPISDPDYQAAEATLQMAPEGAAAALNSLIIAYKNAPNEIAPAIEELNSSLAEVFSEEQMMQYGGQIQSMFREAVGDDPVLMAAFDKIPNTLEGIQQKTLMLQATNLGLKDSIYAFVDEYGNIDSSGLDELIQKTLALQQLNEQFDESLQGAIDSLKAESRAINRDFSERIQNRKITIRGLQDQAEAAQSAHDSYMRQLEDQSRALSKKSDAIRESAEEQQKLIDKQIKSLQVAKEEDSFRRQQAQRATGLLAALASGDMASYFQQRDEFFQAQEDRSQEVAIQALQDKKEQIQEETDAKLKAIEKEQQAIEDARYAAQRAHEDFMANNRAEIEAQQESIEKLERKRNKTLKVVQAQIDALNKAKELGYLTEDQIASLETELNRLGLKLPEGVRNTLKDITDGLFGPDGEYQKLLNDLVSTLADSLGISQEDAKNLLGTYVGELPTYTGGNRGPAGGADSDSSTPYATGGYVSGPGTPTSDSIPARLSNGEYVVKASSVRKYGVGTLDAINEQRFADGGPVGGVTGMPFGALTILSEVALQNMIRSIQTQQTSAASAGGTAAGSGSQWLANFLASMGLTGEKLRVAYAIAMRESSGLPGTISSMDGNGYGLFQIQYGVGHTGIINRTLGTNITENDREGFKNLMLDPINNFKVMMAMSRGLEDLSAWGHYSYNNTALNARSYQSWLTKRTPDGRTWAQAYIMEPFMRYYQSFPGVNDDPVWAGDQPGSNNQPFNPSENPPTVAANSAVAYARSQLGKPYRVPANPPESWDCSKLTAWAWNQAGSGHQRLTPYSHTQGNEIEKRTTSLSGLKPGYVLYFNGIPSPSGGHTSMYIGNGQILEAASPALGVRTTSANNSWNQAYFRWAGPPKGAGYAAGGFVSGPGTNTSDSILARLSNGEFVMNAGSVKNYGVAFMDAINSGKMPGFNKGGYVGPAYSIPSSSTSNFKSSATGGNVEYNINVNVSSSNASADEIVNKTIRTLRTQEKSRRMSIDG